MLVRESLAIIDKGTCSEAQDLIVKRSFLMSRMMPSGFMMSISMSALVERSLIMWISRRIKAILVLSWLGIYIGIIAYSHTSCSLVFRSRTLIGEVLLISIFKSSFLIIWSRKVRSIKDIVQSVSKQNSYSVPW